MQPTTHPGQPTDAYYAPLQPSHPATQPPAPSGTRVAPLWWLVVTTALAALLCIEVATFFLLDMRRRDQAEVVRIEELRAEASRRAEEKAQAEPRVTPVSKTRHECSAVNNEVTCYLTNFEQYPISACMQGLIAQKEAAGVRLYAMPMCTGPIPPRATRSVTAPWASGRASDICKSGGAGYLDWEKCNFTVLDYEPKPGPQGAQQ